MLAPGGAFVVADIIEHTTETAARLPAEIWDEVVPLSALLILSPIALTGLLFLACWWRSKATRRTI
jgi:hypothetical protein